MQATIFIPPEAMKTVEAIRSLDYYDRLSLNDDAATDLAAAPGYFLNTDALHIAELPAFARIAVSLSPAQSEAYWQTVTAPAELRGVVYAGAPHLPPHYGDIIRYWSPITVSDFHQNAVYYQNVHNAYLVQLTVAGGSNAADPYAERMPADDLLTDGIVFSIKGLAARLKGCDPQHFVEVSIPIDPVILGIEHDGLRSTEEYSFDTMGQWERIYLRVADIMSSPNPNHVAISALRSEFQDYGYVY
ncbi:hypothetical protein ABC383_17655 [Noviherbaspirillum sp. 1P10PC]|uniref:hypothetical protein n=1 Tax=Noviherbaspirillum sp. 1P10PC TaxID=3132292 RepID=UPI0039A260D9